MFGGTDCLCASRDVPSATGRLVAGEWMYTVTSSVFVHFGHHVRGHVGPCISLHGHTWKLEIALQAETLDAQGFVADFDVVKAQVLDPCYQLLDHALAVG
ncbi:MAG: hypothetical protein DRI90_14135, partial [Deltaproteobacteria bacterium]